MSVHQVVAQWLRCEAAQLTASLVRKHGLHRLDDIEDALQQALLRAAEVWPYQGVPDRPGAWLGTVARNALIDSYRRRRAPDGELLEDQDVSIEPAEVPLSHEMHDDEVRLLLGCCHPALGRGSRIALTLKVACAFSVEEIARGLLTEPATVAQRIVRAKKQLRSLPDALELPQGAALIERLDPVLDALQLLYSEGYEASSGEVVVRAELCEEALRCADILSNHPVTDLPATRALAAYLHLQHARLHSRVGQDGGLRRLADQDRSSWSQPHLLKGLDLLRSSAHGPAASRFHLLAGIAAEHVMAPSFEQTRWGRILGLYDDLVALEPLPTHRLNRAIALAASGQPLHALAEMDQLDQGGELQDYPWLHAARAEVLFEMGHLDLARRALEAAVACARSEPQRVMLEKKRRRWLS